ncbi:diaminopimelate epimerase [Fructilactobacillus myrtifloralis]|uniref:Diaminopimelate epimerase n=1 Tax=Fructilactobacillus myrtifloralis TaxID=2940301 RepID=A0ABY5BME9_9LACO|nr:diaminopimelate epimerase [Fructilactobacillus myrtifloralis]USS84679.1 diaminopimelate epimerase [Fructilactobacillus myrtifloralis]
MVTLRKVHGSENRFFILDRTQFTTTPTIEQIANLAVNLKQSDNETFNDIDGILVVDASDHSGCLGKMTVVNADGSLASMCGNGLRTVARYLADQTGETKFKVETQDADLHVEQADQLAPEVPAYGVEIAPVRFHAADFPFAELGGDTILNRPLPQLAPDLDFTAIAVPNPHLISFMDHDTLTSGLQAQLGPYLNGENPYFPDGVNLNFAQILGPDRLFVKTYERGVGFTNACGTGMTATSLAYVLNHDQGDFDHVVTVYNPGGMVKVHVARTGTEYALQLIANATTLGNWEIEATDLFQHQFAAGNYQPTTEETAYQNWVATLPQP